MKKLAIVSIILATMTVLLSFAALGLRDVLLSQFDCQSCRKFFSLALSPSDYNTPIAINLIEKRETRLSLFPRYVGPYFLQVYNVPENPKVAITNLICSEDVGFKKVQGGNSSNVIFSGFGNGFIVGGIYISPEQLATNEIISCDIEVTGAERLLLVISRASEL